MAAARLFPPDARVLVALSGGPDSSALLLALCEAANANLLPAPPVGAAHFHHGLRGADADQDAAFSAALASRCGVPCVVGLGNAAPEPRQSPNDAARRARYAFLREAAQEFGANVLVTAHTADDQAETVLLRVLRGTGIDGLAGIPETRILNEGLMVARPLLGLRRAEIEAYCASQGIAPRHDPSNKNNRYARSRLRRRLPDLADAFNPRLTKSLGRLAENAAHDAALLRSLADDLWATTLGFAAPGLLRLHTAPLQTAAPALRRRVLLRALRRIASADASEETATSRFVHDLEALLQSGGTLDLPGPLRAKVHCGVLTLEAAVSPATISPVSYALPLAVPGRVRVAPARLWLTITCPASPTALPRARRALTIDAGAEALNILHGTIEGGPEPCPLLVRNAFPGDRIAPLGMGGKTRLVRDLMADAGWPESLRQDAPLVVRTADDMPLWIVGLAQAEATRVLPGEPAAWRLTAEWDC